jgi:hypothetical protein
MKKLIILLSLLCALGLWAETVVLGEQANQIRLISSSEYSSRIELSLGSFEREAVQIDGRTWYLPTLKKAGLTLEAGYPQVPVMAASVIIPATAGMNLNIIQSEYVDLPMPIAPSKGNLTRNIDPASVPYSFADFYNGDDTYPRNTAYLSEPFIMRDYRGITVRFQPFEYFPDTQTTRVYTSLWSIGDQR